MRVTCIKCGEIVEEFAAQKGIKTYPAKEVKIGRGKSIVHPSYTNDVWICLDCKSKE